MTYPVVEVEAPSTLVVEFEAGDTRVIELGPVVWTSSGARSYTALLSGLTTTIQQADHKLNSITACLALDANGYEFGLLFKINPDKSITVESNIDLTGCCLVISGA